MDEPEPTHAAKTVMVVEDNALNLKLFCDLLRAHGHRAEPVNDGSEVIARAHMVMPDMIVMDIQMPHGRGLALIEAIKADPALEAIPVMAVTAYAASGDEDRIRRAGADACVSKPVRVARFMEVVSALL